MHLSGDQCAQLESVLDVLLLALPRDADDSGGCTRFGPALGDTAWVGKRYQQFLA